MAMTFTSWWTLRSYINLSTKGYSRVYLRLWA